MGVPLPVKGCLGAETGLSGGSPLGLPLGSSLGSSLGATIVNTSMCITMQIQVKFSCVTLPFTGLGWGDVWVSVCVCTVFPQGSPRTPSAGTCKRLASSNKYNI